MQTTHRAGISRRSLLRGLGVSLALPTLPSLATPARAAAAAAVPTRMAFLYIPNGVNVDRWMPTGNGSDFSFGPSLEALTPFRSDLQFIRGLAQQHGFAGPDGAGDHARAVATILTGARPRKTAGADIKAGVSVDQVAASAIGKATRFPSLELSCDASRKSGNCDSGYSCAYSFNMSWRSENQPATAETNPRLLFERLFGAGSGDERAASLAARQQEQKSILDFVLGEARGLSNSLGSNDRRKLDEYLNGVREIEQRVLAFKPESVVGVPDLALPDRPPTAYADHIRLMADMMILAFQTDATRIATFMLAHDGSNRSFPEIGVGDGHHNLSHHQGKEENLEKIARIDRFYGEQFAYVLARMRDIREENGRSLLDNSMVLYTSGLSDGNRHNHNDLPVIMAGSAGGRLTTGRNLVLGEDRPMSNLYLTMLDLMGAPQDGFGDSTGRLDAVLA
ncbi:MAG: DUF1552 domain-containing protein [Planctomycetota bacterium]|nr:DUF1552 domain-containing protein [Planctomycetota bacterium]